ncbi:hypothetical protein B0I35DRAFT_426297 [Stachybotrys elegans]|uniref:Uncharacterized protein n=1 Tax=Stachybotrys elegans TaxID=80388 RepID=A0A8K0SX56_9HYPO|nr:hypothetical protein B0I35DRAFT_426297 [Stachybotrys elegans]
MFNLSNERQQLDPGNLGFFSTSSYSSPQACYDPLRDIGLSGGFHFDPETSWTPRSFNLPSQPWTSSAFRPPRQPAIPDNNLSGIYGQSPLVLSARKPFMFENPLGETKFTLESELKFKKDDPWDSPFPLPNYERRVDKWALSDFNSNLNLENIFLTRYGDLRVSKKLRLSVEAGTLDAAFNTTSINWDNPSWGPNIHLEKGHLGIGKDFGSVKVDIDVRKCHTHGPFELSDDCPACRLNALLDPEILSVRGTYDWQNRSKAQTRVEGHFIKTNWARGAWVFQASHAQNIGPVNVEAGVKKDQNSKQLGWFARLWKYV